MHHHGRGFIYAIIAALFVTLMALFVRLASHVSNETLVFFRNVVSLVIILPFLFTGKFSVKTKRLPLHLLRSATGLTAIYCYFYSVKHLALTNAVLLLNTIPLFIPLVVFVWLKIKIPKRRYVAVALGFAGILLILKPGVGIFEWASLVGAFGGFLGSIAFVSIRQLSKTEDTECILFYYFVFCIVISFFPMLFSWTPIMDWVSWMYIFLVGISAVGYQFFITKSYTYIAATKAGCIMYTAVLFGGFFDWLIWGNLPDEWVVMGTILVIVGGIAALLDKSQPIYIGKKPPK